MGAEEVCVEEGGLLQVDQPPDFRRMQVNDLQRRLAATRRDCSGCCMSWKEARFLLILKVLFLVSISWTMILLLALIAIPASYALPRSQRFTSVLSDQMWLFKYFHLEREGTVFFAVFTAVLAVWVLLKMKPTALSCQRKEEVRIISGLIQHV